MPKTQSETPNEEIKEAESVNFDQPDFVFSPPGRHTYRQEGPYLVCRTCVLHHAVFIGMDRIMVGEDEEGKPILKARSV